MERNKADKLIYEIHAQVCSVFSNAKRLEIINLLRQGEKTAGELTKEMKIAKANVSQQLTVLRDRGILTARRDGQRIYYRLAYPKMLKAYDLLREALIERLQEQGDMAARIRGKRRE
ncbi:MAG: helix-turn-helix transcriptional regulator [Elusimicrobia bacterium]|nr:helix-turn-helix transcriptional regulator [Elusimicrobiota bacterium]